MVWGWVLVAEAAVSNTPYFRETVSGNSSEAKRNVASDTKSRSIVPNREAKYEKITIF
jgi:hypothetical protein